MKMVELGNVAEIIMGQSPPGDTYNTTGDGWPFFQGKTEFGKVSPTAVKWCIAPKKIAQEGDILISVRAPVGPTNLADQECCIGRGLAAIRTNEGIVDRDYIWLYLQYSESFLAEKGQGSTFEAINGDDLNGLEIPDLPLIQQRQIAARLKAQLAEVDKARQAVEVQLRDAIMLAARLREKLLNQLNQVPRLDLGELLLGIEAGKSFQTTDLPARPDELGVLKVSAVSWDEFAPDQAKAVEGDYEPEEKHRVKKGDLIISRANTIELVGAVVRVHEDYPYRLLSDKTLRLIVDETRLKPDYLLSILKLPEARTHIENNATGTSDSMRNISQKTIKKIPVPLVSLNEQNEFVRNAQFISQHLKHINGSIQQQKTELDLLPQKLLSQAFGTSP